MGGLWRDTNVYRENEALSYIFMWNILRHFIVLYLNILWLKTVDEITARQTWTSLCKHDITILCSVEYLTTQIELVLPTFFKSWTVHKVIEYLTLGLLSSLWNICRINVSLNRPPDHTWRRPRNNCSTSYERIPPVRLETSGGVLSTVDMVVQRRDGPGQLCDRDDEEAELLLHQTAILVGWFMV